MYKRLLKVELADTPSQHQRGLMHRHRLGENDGMLFKFHFPQNLRFWGLNTYIPLAIAFVSPEGRIEKISYISPYSTRVVTSDIDCNMAIEANYDFFTRNKVEVGQKVEICKEKDDTYVRFIEN
jgi:uncharacterized membrane protein (UPF0127 family)